MIAHYGTVRSAAAEFNGSVRTAYRLIADGSIRAVKLRGKTLVDMHSLRAYLAALPPAVIRQETAAKVAAKTSARG